jgi:hypothetical protein
MGRLSNKLRGPFAPFFSNLLYVLERNTMSQVTASLVKELRDRTGLGMMECKEISDLKLATDLRLKLSYNC